MAKIRVLAENPPPARGFVENQIRELRDYLTRLKDELEFLLTHLGEDNLNRDLAELTGSLPGLTARVGELETQLAGKQDALTFDGTPRAGSGNPVTSGGTYSAIRSVTRLSGTASTNVTTDAVIPLSESALNYSLLILYGTAGGTAAGNRFCIAVPTVALGNGFFAPVAANSTLGAMRLGVSGGDYTRLRIISQTFSSMTITAVYGKL